MTNIQAYLQSAKIFNANGKKYAYIFNTEILVHNSKFYGYCQENWCFLSTRNFDTTLDHFLTLVF